MCCSRERVGRVLGRNRKRVTCERMLGCRVVTWEIDIARYDMHAKRTLHLRLLCCDSETKHGECSDDAGHYVVADDEEYQSHSDRV
jgi:hypothetical protein